MNKYELAVVVNAKLEDEERAAVIEKVKDYVTRFGGNIIDVDDWGKRRLAYPINKETDAYYVLFNFKSDAEFPAELDRITKITDGVLRSMIIKKEEA